jgi:cardiolipin synthase
MLVLVRDALIVGGAISYHLMIARFQASAADDQQAEHPAAIDAGTWRSIANHGIIPLPPRWLLETLIGLTTLTTVWSGVAYVWRWGHDAWRQRHHPSDRPPPSS